MKRALLLAKRNAKEILRDPLNLCFGLGFPLVLLGLLTAIQANVPKELFPLDQLTPGITVFGLSFMSLFSATLIARDRSSALLLRLYTTPLRPLDYILGYALPMVPIALAQSAITLLFGLILGLTWTPRILLCLLVTVPMGWIFIGTGLLCGSLLTDKQVGGICGALLTNLTGWFAGIWFDVELAGGFFKTVSNILPFYHGVELARAAYAGTLSSALSHLWVVLAWALGLLSVAVWAFLHQMRKN